MKMGYASSCIPQCLGISNSSLLHWEDRTLAYIKIMVMLTLAWPWIIAVLDWPCWCAGAAATRQVGNKNIGHIQCYNFIDFIMSSPIISRWFHIVFNFDPNLGRIPILTNIFQMGWKHHLDILWHVCWKQVSNEKILVVYVTYRGWKTRPKTTRWCGDQTIIRIPSLNNQYFMENKRFFFVAQMISVPIS